MRTYVCVFASYINFSRLVFTLCLNLQRRPNVVRILVQSGVDVNPGDAKEGSVLEVAYLTAQLSSGELQQTYLRCLCLVSACWFANVRFLGPTNDFGRSIDVQRPFSRYSQHSDSARILAFP